MFAFGLGPQLKALRNRQIPRSLRIGFSDAIRIDRRANLADTVIDGCDGQLSGEVWDLSRQGENVLQTPGEFQIQRLSPFRETRGLRCAGVWTAKLSRGAHSRSG